MRGTVRIRMVRGALIALATAAAVIGLAPSASATYLNEPVGPAWTPNAGVHSVLAAGNTVYVGGSFTGGVAALDSETGALKWLGNANGDVRALALAPNGRLILGGAFDTVGGATHRKLAAVNAGSGAVDPGFRAAVGGTVRDVVVLGNTAYFGGAFTAHGGMTQRGLGAVDATTGANVTGFTAATNGNVYALGTDGTRLFVGGEFTTLGGLPRNQLGSITLASNAVDAWAPAKACTYCNLMWDLAVDPARNRVYTVGRNAGTLFTVDRTTGATVYRNVGGSVNGDSQAVTLAPDGRVYVGGHFTSIAGQARMLVAEIDVSTTTPRVGAFSSRFVTSYPGVWGMTASASRLYVGGDFTAAGSKVNNQNRYPYFAMFPVAPAPDTTVPTVTARSPGANATGALPAGNVTATFSEPVQGVGPATFTLRTTAGAAVTGTVTYDAGTRIATLDPGVDLAPATQYTATLTGGATGIRDLANNALATTSWTFTTAAAAPPPDTTPPTATVAPAQGATGVPVTSTVTATFSEPVQGVSGATFTLAPAGGGAAVAATVAAGAGNTWVLDPTADLAASTQYTATLTGGAAAIRDLANNALATRTWSFTTGVPADTTPPVWTGRIPSADGATGVSRTANVTIAFNEQVQNVTTTTFTVTPTAGGTPVPATVAFNTTNGRWVLNPTSSLAATTQYTATVTSAVTDLAGNPFAGVTWSFTTGA